jgi:hypothetical protein
MEAQPYYQPHGVETDDAAAFARARGLDVQSGAATRQTFEQIGPVDPIVMLDVIEHLENPGSVLQLCAEYLRPGGLFLSRPRISGRYSRNFSGKRWRLMTPPSTPVVFYKVQYFQVAARHGLVLEHFVHPWKKVPLSLILYKSAECLESDSRCPKPAGSSPVSEHRTP